VIDRALELRREHPEALVDARALTRLLCGISSPRISRARLGRHALFGALAETPFAEVLQRLHRELDDSGAESG
jgi:ATP-dependent DNA helicase RecQ